MYIRSKIVKGTTYYQVVEGYRDEAGRVRHRTLASLGQSPTIAGAVEATEWVLRRVRRKAAAARRSRPEQERPRWSEKRLALLERCVARLEEQRRRLRDLIERETVDTTGGVRRPSRQPDRPQAGHKATSGGRRGPVPQRRGPAASTGTG